MFSYSPLGTCHKASATAFYDAALALLGHQRVADYDPAG